MSKIIKRDLIKLKKRQQDSLRKVKIWSSKLKKLQKKFKDKRLPVIVNMINRKLFLNKKYNFMRNNLKICKRRIKISLMNWKIWRKITLLIKKNLKSNLNSKLETCRRSQKNIKKSCMNGKTNSMSYNKNMILMSRS